MTTKSVDNLSDVLVPSLIERFDAIPYDRAVNGALMKGDVALLIKGMYQLHNGLAALLKATEGMLWTDDNTGQLVSQARSALQSSQHSLTYVSERIIDAIVSEAETSR